MFGTVFAVRDEGTNGPHAGGFSREHTLRYASPDMSSPVQIPWHAMDSTSAIDTLHSHARSGLTSEEAARRLAEHGPNELRQAEGPSPWGILLDQFKNVLILILLAAVALSIVLGEAIEAIAIAVIVLFAAVLGFIQEYRAERALEALRRLAAPTATAVRDGRETQIAARDLVPGDLVVIHAGDKVPADGRCVETSNLRIDEATLTGESLPVEKHTRTLQADLAVADRRNLVYAGTTATYGRGRVLVIGTGMDTEFGRIAGFLETVERSRTPLQNNLDRLGAVLAKAALATVIVVAAVGMLRGSPPLEMVLFGVALAVAVVPEALPAVVTISLAIGVQRMARRHSLIRRLPAVETLGSVSIICSDKTGTLTRDEMTVREVLVGDRLLTVSGSGYEPKGAFCADGIPVEADPLLRTLLEAAVLSSDATLVRSPVEDPRATAEGGWAIQGDPTEGALIVAAAKAGFDKATLDQRFQRIDEIPFTSESKRMTTLHEHNGERIACAKGAPEIILQSCNRILGSDGIVPLEESHRQAILDHADRMANDALRVLGIATKQVADRSDAERDMMFVGLIGMIDPPRLEAHEAVKTCTKAGIRPVMITGDHPATARAIARELGILNRGRVLRGTDLDALDDAALAATISDVSVFARVSPAHKLRVVTALQEQHQSVAMTGDGINDAPALKKSNIGIAMGITGTDVTKEAADMTLTDDNFASIVAAIEEGRGVYENIKKYLLFLLSSNLGEIVLLATSALLGWPLPLSAVQILYVNLATDGLPALALAVDPYDVDLMNRPPRKTERSIFTPRITTLLVAGGLWSAIVNLGFFNWALTTDRSLEHAMTMVLVSLVLIQFFKAYCFRSESRPVWVRPFTNRWLNLAIGWEVALMLAVVYAPFLQRALGTDPLSLVDWVLITGVSLSVVPVIEVAKRFLRQEPGS